MQRFLSFLLCLSVLGALVGCGDDGNKVATQDELKAFAEQYGDTKLDPTASTPLTD
jgi:hypothetical protein